MKINTIIQLKDKRIGTICHHNLDGYGGVWGKFTFNEENCPKPKFMLRNEYAIRSLHEEAIKDGIEFVGTKYKIIK